MGWYTRVPCAGYILIFLKVMVQLPSSCCCLIIAVIDQVVVHTGTNLAVAELPGVDPLPLLLYRSILLLSVSLPWSVLAGRPPFPPDQPARTSLALLFRGAMGGLNMWARLVIRLFKINNSLLCLIYLVSTH